MWATVCLPLSYDALAPVVHIHLGFVERKLEEKKKEGKKVRRNLFSFSCLEHRKNIRTKIIPFQ